MADEASGLNAIASDEAENKPEHAEDRNGVASVPLSNGIALIRFLSPTEVSHNNQGVRLRQSNLRC